MRKVLIYFILLFAAGAVVFLLAFGLGRRSSLESELARRTALPPGTERSLTIESLRPSEEEDPDLPGEEIPPPETKEIGGDFTVTRYPLQESGMVLLLDGMILAPGGQGYFPVEKYLRGLEGFFGQLPEGIRVGLRTLGSALPADCGETVRLRAAVTGGTGELRSALRDAPSRGPRSIARALGEGAADLAGVAGERAVVLVTGGDEECGGIPCQVAADLELLGGPKVHVVVVLPPAFDDPFAAPPPAWLARMECVAEKGRGGLHRTTSPEELQAALVRIASSLRPNVTVRAFHAAGRELEGESVESRRDWGAAISPSGGPSTDTESSSFPASFSVPAGEFDLRVWYRGQERTVKGLRVGPAERLEVAANFRAGELYLQARDAAGEEMVGDTADFDCFWGAEVFEGGDLNRDYGSSCAFPAYFVLRPGSYTVRLWKGTVDYWLENVAVREEETTVETVTFREEEEAQ